MTPLADILRELGFELHVYANDNQFYLAFQPIDQDSDDVVVNKSKVAWLKSNNGWYRIY